MSRNGKKSEIIVPALPHRVRDWLDLHELAPIGDGRSGPTAISALVSDVTRLADDPMGPAPAHRIPTGLPPEAAWRLVVEAVSASFPSRRSVIDQVAKETMVNFANTSDQPRDAYTLGGGKGSAPFIFCPYLGRVGDLLTLAHEFGHALQIMCSKGGFMPPLDREICAFVAELCLLDHLKRLSSPFFEPTMLAWRRDNRKYLVDDGLALSDALTTPESSYQYCLNYPVARVAAGRTYRWLPPDLAWKVFEGHAPRLAAVERIPAVNDRSLQPVGPDMAAALGRYRRIGCAVESLWAQSGAEADLNMMDTLDLIRQHPGREVEASESGHMALSDGWIDYYVALGLTLEVFAGSDYHCGFRPSRYFPVQVLAPLRLGQARFYLSTEGRPTGMVTWAWLSETEEAAVLESGGRLDHATTWNSGDRLFFYDWISERRTTLAMMKDLIHDVFARNNATSIRRADDGSVRKICRWKGSKAI